MCAQGLVTVHAEPPPENSSTQAHKQTVKQRPSSSGHGGVPVDAASMMKPARHASAASGPHDAQAAPPPSAQHAPMAAAQGCQRVLNYHPAHGEHGLQDAGLRPLDFDASGAASEVLQDRQWSTMCISGVPKCVRVQSASKLGICVIKVVGNTNLSSAAACVCRSGRCAQQHRIR